MYFVHIKTFTFLNIYNENVQRFDGAGRKGLEYEFDRAVPSANGLNKMTKPHGGYY